MDPLADAPANTSWSVYHYVWNNPLKFIDPDGRHGQTTIVGDNKDGTYTVHDVIHDGSTDVKLADGTKVGESLTTHSFVDNNGNAVLGAIIDTKSSEGQEFIDKEIIDGDPSLMSYMFKARHGGKFDFKTRDESTKKGTQKADQYRYRGSMTSDGKMASARDFGNMGAGIVAGRRPYLTYSMTRKALDAYNGSPEPPVTTKAQEIGFNIGRTILNNYLDKVNSERE